MNSMFDGYLGRACIYERPCTDTCVRLKAFFFFFTELYCQFIQTIHTQPSKPTTHKPHPIHTDTTTPTTTTTTVTNTHPLWQHPDVQHALHHHINHTHTSLYHNERNTQTWPGTEDVYINSLLLRFAEHVAGNHGENNCTCRLRCFVLWFVYCALSDHFTSERITPIVNVFW